MRHHTAAIWPWVLASVPALVITVAWATPLPLIAALPPLVVGCGRSIHAIATRSTAPLTMAVVETATIPGSADAVDGVIQAIDHELGITVASVGEQTEHTVRRIGEVAGTVAAISGRSRSMSEAAEATAATTHDVVAANADLRDAIARVAEQAEQTTHLLRDGQHHAEAVGSAMSEMRAAVDEVGDIAHLIADIAARTNLLALNATIEAARAGVAGRGFAVVANEVKDLASQTALATRQIDERIEAIRVSAARTGAGIDDVVGSIGRIDEAATATRGAVAVQRELASRIAGAAERAVEHVQALSDDVRAVAARADASAVLATGVTARAKETARVVDRLGADTMVNLRTTTSGNRRLHPRVPCEVAATLSVAGRVIRGRTRDLSLGGALVTVDEDPSLATGAQGRIDIDGVGEVGIEVRNVTALGLHLAFRATDAGFRERVQARLDAVREEDQRFGALVREGADQIAARFERALADRRISIDKLFDTDYVPIDGTDPQQFETAFTELCDAVLPEVQEPLKATSERVVFCAAMDRNAYLPTHNAAFAKPQRPDDPAWNAANSRHRRKFDDRAGRAAARNTEALLMQSYFRDMGNGNHVMMKEVDAPITVRGRHWGCLRLAYRLR